MKPAKPLKVLLKTYFGNTGMFYKTIKEDGTQRIWSNEVYLNNLPALPFIDSQVIERTELRDVSPIDPDLIPNRIKKNLTEGGITYLMIIKPGKKMRTIIEEYIINWEGRIEAVQWKYEY